MTGEAGAGTHAAPRAPLLRRSLAVRLVAGATVVLALSLGAIAAILVAATRDGLEEAARQRLQAHVFALLAVVDVGPEGEILMPGVLPEPRLSRPDSGLYAAMVGDSDSWLSPSAMGENPILPATTLEPASTEFLRRYDLGPELAYVFRQGIAWETEAGEEQRFVLTVAEDEGQVEDQVRRFRNTLWAWMTGAAVLLLGLQVAVLRWGLRPVRELAQALAAVKRGDQESIDEAVPDELAGLTSGLNAFIASERKHLHRYRNSLADLAHSLKTPLAVLRTGLEPTDPDDLLDQVDRMDELVAYQLKRARTTGNATLSRPVSVEEAVSQLVRALDKVHAERRIDCAVEIAPAARFFGDRADLMELLGNLVDNAYKWADSRVRVSARALSTSAILRPGLELRIEDDGPGIPAAAVEALLERGARADERVPGHGIGLAIVADIAEAYGGTLAFDTSSLGGAAAILHFPEE